MEEEVRDEVIANDPHIGDEGLVVEEGSDDDDTSDTEEESDVDIQPARDSDYISECDDISYDHRVHHLATEDILALNDDTIICRLHVSHCPRRGVNLCARCFMRTRDRYAEAFVVRTHRTGRYDRLLGRWCSDCSCALDIMFIRNICPVCNSCKYLFIYLLNK